VAVRTGTTREAIVGECCSSVMSAPLDDGQAAELAAGFSALGDPVRLKLLALLASSPGGEVCVCDLVGPVGKSQGTVSHHLKILGEAGLVVGDRRGKWVWYSVIPDRLEALQQAISR
jgi:ArsR family transcriptional regulator